MNVIILQTQEGDWEGLFINGNCVEQDHKLGQGWNMFSYVLNISEKYNFTSQDIKGIYTVVDEDEDFLMGHGRFPSKLSELKGVY